MFRRSAFLLLTFFLFFSFAGAQDTLKFATSKNVGPLNPHQYSPNQMFAQDMVYEGLVEYGEDGNIIPKLATSWKRSADGLVYTFTLREGVVFSNGEKFDAKAAKANFDAVLANRNRHIFLELTKALKECKIVDDKTIELHLTSPDEQILYELAAIRPYRFVAPSSMFDGKTADGVKSPIGTGKWKLIDTKLGISDTFERNENYYGVKPKFKYILSKVIPDSNTKVIALKTGDVDFVYGTSQIPVSSFEELKNEGFKTLVGKPVETLAIAINSAKFPTSDLSVRKAFNLILDKDSIIKNIFLSTQIKADTLFSPSEPFGDAGLKPYGFDMKLAAQLLEQDGWKLNPKDNLRYKNGKVLQTELSYIGNDSAQKAIGEVLQDSFKKIGGILELKADESTIFYKKQQNGSFGLIFNPTWGAPYGVQGFLAAMRSPSHADYEAQRGLKQKAWIDETITNLLKLVDVKKKQEMINSVLKVFQDEAVYLPISYDTNKVVAGKNFSGLEASVMPQRIMFDKLQIVK